MRLDLYLFENGYTRSRTEAKSLISEGGILVDGKIASKASLDVSSASCISVVKEHKFVSRGGLKLDGALNFFEIDVTGVNAIDIGASSGGFTDCLLKRGASKVIALDSGYGQLVSTVAEDSRVYSIENYNARFLTSSDLPYTPDFAVMDVSFISATLIIPCVYSVLRANSGFVCLVKPQFEVGKQNVGKGGIVKDKKLHEMAISRVVSSATACGFRHIGTVKSPIEGGDGNTEYLAYFRKS